MSKTMQTVGARLAPPPAQWRPPPPTPEHGLLAIAAAEIRIRRARLTAASQRDLERPAPTAWKLLAGVDRLTPSEGHRSDGAGPPNRSPPCPIRSVWSELKAPPSGITVGKIRTAGRHRHRSTRPAYNVTADAAALCLGVRQRRHPAGRQRKPCTPTRPSPPACGCMPASPADRHQVIETHRPRRRGRADAHAEFVGDDRHPRRQRASSSAVQRRPVPVIKLDGSAAMCIMTSSRASLQACIVELKTSTLRHLQHHGIAAGGRQHRHTQLPALEPCWPARTWLPYLPVSLAILRGRHHFRR